MPLFIFLSFYHSCRIFATKTKVDLKLKLYFIRLFLFEFLCDIIVINKKESGVTVIKNKTAIPTFISVFILNFILFALKLYVGLSSNSISIYSDGINNFFDGISAVTGIICFMILAKSRDLSFASRSGKTEQLLSFFLSAVILITGFVFLYNSSERLMYPAPMWFTVSYFYMIAATVLVKLGMFFMLKRQSKKTDSGVIKMMALDSLADFFITAVTLITLLVSQKGGFSVDAYAGIAISVIILISGIKSFKEGLVGIIGFPSGETRNKIEKLLSEYGISDEAELEFSFSDEKKVYLKTDKEINEETLENIKNRLSEGTGFTLYLLK